MQLTIKYFGLLAEVVGHQEETRDISGQTISDLLDELYDSYEELKTKAFKVALNQQIVDRKTQLTEGEIALLPPFSGG